MLTSLRLHMKICKRKARHYPAIVPCESADGRVVLCKVCSCLYVCQTRVSFSFSFRSVYRELLFLSLTACGAENIDVGKWSTFHFSLKYKDW